jgi:chromosome segregation ATPase
MTERADRDVARLRLLETDKQALGREKEMQYSRVLAHEAKIGALHEQAAALGQELDELKRAHEHAATEAARVPGLAKTLAHRSEELDLARREAQRLATELEDARKAAAAELERRRNEIESLENALRLARSEARDAADRLEAARADKAMLHGAVETLRAERAHQRRNNGVEMVSEPPSQADVAALRSALADFGTRVAELAEPAPERVE